jgi:hypothetical protein
VVPNRPGRFVYPLPGLGSIPVVLVRFPGSSRGGSGGPVALLNLFLQPKDDPSAEMVLDVVHGADLCCNRNCKTNPVDLEGSRGQVGPKRPKIDPFGTSQTPDFALKFPEIKRRPLGRVSYRHGDRHLWRQRPRWRPRRLQRRCRLTCWGWRPRRRDGRPRLEQTSTGTWMMG